MSTYCVIKSPSMRKGFEQHLTQSQHSVMCVIIKCEQSTSNYGGVKRLVKLSPKKNYKNGQNYLKKHHFTAWEINKTQINWGIIHRRLRELQVRTAGVFRLLVSCCSVCPSSVSTEFWTRQGWPWNPSALLPESTDLHWMLKLGGANSCPSAN